MIKKRKPYKTYTKEFKREAVRLMQEADKPQTQEYPSIPNKLMEATFMMLNRTLTSIETFYDSSLRRIWPTFLSLQLGYAFIAALLACCVMTNVAAQTDDAPARTPWGDPNLEGVWVNNVNTPIEKPDAELDASRLAALAEWFPGGGWGGVPGVNQPIASPAPGERVTLITDPLNGRIPVRAAAEAERDYMLNHLTDSHENHTLWERCITRGTPLYPSNYNNGYQIFQTPDYIAILHEMIHEVRIIPLDGRTAPSFPQWMGHGRGHWDGNTLVVETANFTENTIVASSLKSLALRGLPHTKQLKIVERFTRSNTGTLDYEVTLDDPGTYTRPWTAAFPLDYEPEYGMYEYACHEGNYGLPNSLRGARAVEARAAKAGSE